MEIDEFTAAVAVEAFEWHLGHLGDEMKRTRDRVDREGYANARLQHMALIDFMRLIRGHLAEMGADTPHAVAALRRRTDGANAGIPQSPANAHILRAERAVRDAARAEYKAARAEQIASQRRTAGGKWARPRIVAADDTGEAVNDVEP